ncbi:hypothetical protein CMI47_17610 [Candidatus Pacearchaeota archaeon]|nr:hypothetical protein [Candidatus Pacearchaeota archaeon]|tara:strand:+ start:3087 stop:3554 length:468 start_codon:yes stop_codon:yes gene_type:complete
MKKLLISFIVLGIFSIFGSIGVLAVDQGINASVGENITVLISPAIVEFGPLLPGTFNNPAITGDITFNATGSNSNISIEVVDVDGTAFAGNLFLNAIDPLVGLVTLDLDCTPTGLPAICAYPLGTLIPTLNVPTGTPAGVQSGIITYLITGTPPF